jgi:hypothetical protein
MADHGIPKCTAVYWLTFETPLRTPALMALSKRRAGQAAQRVWISQHYAALSPANFSRIADGMKLK